jgi:cobalt-precorrin-5B (C1)-methyltransferase
VMLGKAVKLAAGHTDTHSRKTTMDKDFVKQMLEEAGCSIDMSNITLARELWRIIPKERVQDFCNVIIRHCAAHCESLLPQGSLTILLLDDDGTIHSLSQEHPQGQ